MTRDEGIKMVKYDHVVPKDLFEWLNYVNMSENEFYKIADTFRSPKVWIKKNQGWIKQNIWDK